MERRPSPPGAAAPALAEGAGSWVRDRGCGVAGAGSWVRDRGRGIVGAGSRERGPLGARHQFPEPVETGASVCARGAGDRRAPEDRKQPRCPAPRARCIDRSGPVTARPGVTVSRAPSDTQGAARAARLGRGEAANRRTGTRSLCSLRQPVLLSRPPRPSPCCPDIADRRPQFAASTAPQRRARSMSDAVLPTLRASSPGTPTHRHSAPPCPQESASRTPCQRPPTESCACCRAA